jgi:5'-3' exonuclease
MGVQDLYKTIKQNYPEQIQEFSLSQWRGHVLSIDISIFLCKFIKSAGGYLWMNSFFIFLSTLKKHGIKAVAIFDGPNPPIEKKLEQESRRANFDKAKKRLKKARKIRDILQNDYLPANEKDIPLELQKKCQLIVGTKRKIPRVVRWNDALDVYDILSELITSLDKAIAPITNLQREQAWEITRMMGIPTFQADGEAEALCAYLTVHGYCDATLSEDSDTLAYGTPWFLSFKDYKLSDEKVRGIHLPSLLEAMNFTIDQFRDLCILLSCDYNQRVKGFLPGSKKGKKPTAIGAVGAMKLITHYKSLEACEPHIEDITPLNYKRCRQLFTPITTQEMKELIEVVPLSMKPDFDKIKQFIKDEKLTVSIEHIQTCWKPAIINFYDSEDEDCIYAKFTVQEVEFYVCFPNENVFNEAKDSNFKEYQSIFNAWIDEEMELTGSIKFKDILDDKPENVKILQL